MAEMYRSNRLFAKHGHECQLRDDSDELVRYIPGNTLYSRFKRALVRARLVSELSTHSAKLLRSQGAIRNEKVRHLKNYYHMIHPFSDARKWWEFLMVIVFFVQFVMIPLDIAYFSLTYYTFPSNPVWKSVRFTFDCLCIVDVILRFFTGYYHHTKKTVILDYAEVGGHYLRTYFIFDFVSSLPTHFDLFFEISGTSTIFKILQVTSVLKLFRMATFIRYSYSFAETFNVWYAGFRSLIVVLGMFLGSNFFCCLLVFVYACNEGYFWRNGDDDEDAASDLPSPNVARMFIEQADNSSYALITYHLSSYNNNITPRKIHGTLKDKQFANGSYATSYYISIMILTNAGFGKVDPDSNVERILVSLTWLIAKIVFAFFLSRIMQILTTTTSSSQKYMEMVRELKEYMQHKKLPEHMQRRFLTYYEFRFQKSYFRESEILSTISGQLRQEIVMHSCRKLVENVVFFKNLPLTLLVRIVSCLKQEIFLTNDVIVRAKTVGDSMYFIASGTVAIYTVSGKEVCHLEDGAHFGEIALVMKEGLRQASVIAVEVCELYRLDRKNFVRAIHPYPDLLDNIQRIASDRMERTTMLDEHNRREQASRNLG